jgi:ribosomal protein S4
MPRMQIEGQCAMSKRKASKYKIDRRMGENIWGRPKSSVNRRSYGPGQHGQRRKSKVSDFGIQLRAKQKLKGYYGDVISLGNKAKDMALIAEAQGLAERDIPDYVAPDGTEKATFVRVPTLDEVPYPVKMEPNLVVEFYSR